MEQGFLTCVTVPVYSKSVMVIVHRVTPPTRTGSCTRGARRGDGISSRFTYLILPLTVPLMSAIKAGHVRDTSVMRVRAPPEVRLRLPLRQCARAGRPSPGPGLALVPGHDAASQQSLRRAAANPRRDAALSALRSCCRCSAITELSQRCACNSAVAQWSR